jgi:hypothetical protein
VVVSKARRWLVAAALLAVGLPLLAGAGFGLTLAVCMMIQPMRRGASLAPCWAGGFIAICVALWFLVRWCVRAGGWRALSLGGGAVVLVAAAALAVGSLEQSMQPSDSMAGLGMDLLAFGLGLLVLVALMMGAIVSLIGCARQAAPTGEEPTDDVG